MPEQDNRPTCVVCRLIRNYLLVAVPVILVLYTKPEITSLRSIDLTWAAAALCTLLLLVVVAWKAYREFWKPKSDGAKKSQP